MYKIEDVKGYEELLKEYDNNHLIAKLVKVYGYTKTDIGKDLKDPYTFLGMKEISNLVLNHISKKNKIVVYGDYDCDGVCATSIVVKTLKKFTKEVGFFIPDRYENGYGLDKDVLKSMVRKGYKLLIAVDCGIKNNEEIEYARKKGMDVIVIDHHESGDTLPNANAILHPVISNISSYNMCAGLLAFYFSKAMLGYEDEYLLTLAGLATVADVMPLVEENKLVVAKALDILNKNKYLNFTLLSDNTSYYDEKTFAFKIAPKINSIGRIIKGTKVNLLVDFFVLDNKKKIYEIYDFIKSTNDSRKEMTKDFLNRIDVNLDNNNYIAIFDEDVLEGICGLVASNLANKYDVLTFIFAKSEKEGLFKGSSRSNDVIDVTDFLEEVSPILEAFGGHKKAAGLSLREENKEKFLKGLEDYVKDYPKKEKIYNVVEVSKEELTYDTYLKIREFAPFGEGNNEPLFLIRNIKGKDLRRSKDNKHLLGDINDETSLVMFNFPNKIKEDSYYHFVFTLEVNQYYLNSITCKVSDYLVKEEFKK